MAATGIELTGAVCFGAAAGGGGGDVGEVGVGAAAKKDLTNSFKLKESELLPAAAWAGCEGGGGVGAEAAAAFGGGAPPTVIFTSSWPALTVVPSGTSAASTTPLTGLGIGTDVLSVSISKTTSSTATGSPTFLIHLNFAQF